MTSKKPESSDKRSTSINANTGVDSQLPAARVLNVRMRRGLPIAVVKCPHCGGVHKHKVGRGPGRAAPCADFAKRYVMVATVEQLVKWSLVG